MMINKLRHMFNYDHERLKLLLGQIITQNVSTETWDWLQLKAINVAGINMAFVAIPRKTGKSIIRMNEGQAASLAEVRTDFYINNWTTDRLTRVWLLFQFDIADQNTYRQNLENLFLAAEMNELVALYSSLPLLAYHEMWIDRCAEGIRSNMGSVLEAIMYNNPYPAENLPQPAWNQMILKAFFTEKQISLITGLSSRANKDLANMLTDYARERHAAGRGVDPALWQLASRFIDVKVLEEVKLNYL